MATIAQLATIFTVDNSQFKAGLRDSEKRARNSSRSIVGHTKNMARSFRGTINSVFNLRTAVATLAGSAGIGLLVKNELNAIDQTAKFSRTLGVTTEDLVSYRHAASLAGVEQSVMDSSMTALIKRLGELRSNTGPMVTFFKKYDKTLLENIKTQENAGGAMAVIAEAIKNAANEADAAAIANAAFSRQGVKMAEIFRDRGAAALKEAREEADRLGITFNAFDASQVEMANDAINRMQKAFKGVSTQLAINLAPLITAVANEITEAQTNSDALFKAMNKGGRAMLGTVKALADGVHTIMLGFQGLRVAALGFSALFINVGAKGLDIWSSLLNFVIDKINVVIGAFNKIPGGPKIPLIQNLNKEGFIADVQEMADVSIGALKDARAELGRMMTEPLPSQAIDEFVAKVKERTAQARAAASSGASGGGAAAGGGGVAPADEQEKKTRERKLEFIRQSMMTEMELERQQHEKKLEFIQETDESMFEYEGEKRRIIESMEAQHQERLKNIEARGQSQMLQQNIKFLKRMEQARASSGAAQVNIATDALQQITAAGATESKKMFKINKAAAIANAIISTYQGAAKAMEWGFPLGPIFAAVMIAAGLAQVRHIKSQQFQGGGAGGGGGGAVAPSVGPTPAPPVTPVNGQGETGGQQAPERSVNIVVNGPIDRTYLRDAFLPALSEEINENDVTFINSESAQSRELARANR